MGSDGLHSGRSCCFKLLPFQNDEAPVAGCFHIVFHRRAFLIFRFWFYVYCALKAVRLYRKSFETSEINLSDCIAAYHISMDFSWELVFREK